MGQSSGHTQRVLAITLLFSLVMWNLPFGGFLLYPFKLLATWLHELSHGIVMMTIGVGFKHMLIYQDTSGLAYANSAATAPGLTIIAAAGYMGTPVFGGTLLILGQTVRGTRIALLGLATLLLIPALFYVGNQFGQAVGLLGSIIFLLLAVFSGTKVSGYVANFVAAQSCINAVLDIRTLFRSNLSVNNGSQQIASDAHNMAEATGIGVPALWAVIWLAWSFLVFYVALRLLYLRQRRKETPPMPATQSQSNQETGTP